MLGSCCFILLSITYLPIYSNKVLRVRFQVLTAASTNMAILWIVAACSLVGFYRRFRGSCCLHHQGDDHPETSETSVNFYQTTRRNNPEDSHLQSVSCSFSNDVCSKHFFGCLYLVLLVV
jgi:hypothetical protein